MSDFNTMFAEQMSIEESTGTTQRILEAMLKRDQLEIQYRQQGYSESQIAEFHEKATQAIQEGLGDYAARAKGAMSRGWKNVKAGGSALWQKIKELFAKFIAFCKKVWVTVRNFFSKDNDFLKRYEKELNDPENQKRYADVEYDLPSDSMIGILTKKRSFDSAEKYEAAAKEMYSLRIETKSFKGKQLVDTAKKMLEKNGDADSLMKNDVDEADAEEKRLDKIENEDELKLAKAKLMYLRARNALNLRYIKARHKAAKAAIVRCIAKCKSVKESTIEFMVESACSELDKMYAFAEADKDESREYRKISGNGVWSGIKNVGHNIIAWFKRVYDWIKDKLSKAWIWIKTQWAKLKKWWNGEPVEVAKVDKPKVQKAIKSIEKQLDQLDTNDDDYETGNRISDIPDDDNYGDFDEIIKSTQVTTQQEVDNSIKDNSDVLTELRNLMAKIINSGQKIPAQSPRQKVLDHLKRSVAKLISQAQNGLNISRRSIREIERHLTRTQNSDKNSYSTRVRTVASTSRVGAGDLSPEELGESAGLDLFMSDAIQEAYILMAEAMDKVDPIIGNAMNGSACGITDVNLAGTDILGSGVSSDPNHLVYDDDLYSQTVSMGDEGIAGTVGSDISGTDTSVKSGNETPSVNKEAYELAREFTELEMMI